MDGWIDKVMADVWFLKVVLESGILGCCNCYFSNACRAFFICDEDWYNSGG
jgi:hypothetical protein